MRSVQHVESRMLAADPKEIRPRQLAKPEVALLSTSVFSRQVRADSLHVHGSKECRGDYEVVAVQTERAERLAQL